MTATSHSLGVFMKGRHIFFTIIAIILPFVLLMNAIICVFTPQFLISQYRSADFPPDPFGFTLEERIKYGTESVNYITDYRHQYADDYLAGLKKEDGTLLYNEREVSHMYDVRVLFQNARFAMALMIVFIIITMLLVSKRPNSLPGFLKSLSIGASITLFLILLVGIGILTGFDAFFEAFHHLFFTGDSWLFWENDSLIRLFPEPLWIHGFTLVAILTAAFAIVILLITYFAGKRITKTKGKMKENSK